MATDEEIAEIKKFINRKPGYPFKSYQPIVETGTSSAGFRSEKIRLLLRSSSSEEGMIRGENLLMKGDKTDE